MQGLPAGDLGYRPAGAGATAREPGDLQILTQITLLAEGTAGLPGMSSVLKHLRGMSFIHLFR